ncbi:UNVERIFIED_CONTAM: hypothetical protein Slati_3927300 [Sesamum latifolium]|uniref:Uncharacterized protein n=1 Tax=Sesamum latifolium TaxID=2727402 RepID=A0AAW2TNF5_9LAMI
MVLSGDETNNVDGSARTHERLTAHGGSSGVKWRTDRIWLRCEQAEVMAASGLTTKEAMTGLANNNDLRAIVDNELVVTKNITARQCLTENIIIIECAKY